MQRTGQWHETLLYSHCTHIVCTPLLHGSAIAALLLALQVGELHNTADSAHALLEVDKHLLQGIVLTQHSTLSTGGQADSQHDDA